MQKFTDEPANRWWSIIFGKRKTWEGPNKPKMYAITFPDGINWERVGKGYYFPYKGETEWIREANGDMAGEAYDLAKENNTSIPGPLAAGLEAEGAIVLSTFKETKDVAHH